MTKVFGFTVEDVLTPAADQHVVSRLAVRTSSPDSTDQDIVAIPAIGRELDAARLRAPTPR